MAPIRISLPDRVIRRRLPMGLRGRLLLLLLLVLIPAFLLIAYNTVHQRQHAYDDAVNAAQQLVQLLALEQKQILTSAKQELLTLSQLPIVRQQHWLRLCNETFSRLLKQNPHYGNLGVADLNGQLRCSGAPLTRPINIANRGYFRQALATRDIAISDYLIGRVTGKASLTLGYPVLNDAGQPDGVVFAAVDLAAWVLDVTASQRMPEGSTVTVIDSDNTILARYPDPERWTGKHVPESALAKAIRDSDGEGQTEAPGLDQVTRLYVFAPLYSGPRDRIYVSAGIPTEQVFAASNRSFVSNLFWILMIMAVTSLAAWYGSSHLILRPVTSLIDAADRLGHGELHARTGLSHSAGELGHLAASFDRMAGNLEHSIQQVRDAETEIRALNSDLENRVRDRTTQLQAANQELEAFSYSVSHDLRAPLRAIDGFSQALLEDSADRLDSQGRDYLDRIRAATQRMGHLIDDMLTLSRVTRSDMKNETVDLSALATDVLTDLAKSEPARQVAWHVEPGLSVQGDARLLRVVLVNLLGNAWKFTGKTNDAKIDFGATRGDHEPLVYFVRDNGAGFDMKYVDKLFGAFQRLHATSEFTGTGIGLATVQRIIRRHGGRVWADGAPGQGAVFHFTLATQEGTPP